jgi:hypothetical protein
MRGLLRVVGAFAGRCAAIASDMLSPDALRRIDREIAKYPPDRKQSAVMSALAVAQDEYGWLSVEAMDEVAQYLGMPPVAVYASASSSTRPPRTASSRLRRANASVPAATRPWSS